MESRKPVRFTDLSFQNWKRPGETSDAVQRGMRVWVSEKTGAKSVIYRFRDPITRRSDKMTLPPGVGLAQARKLCSDAAFQVAQGVNPKTEKRAERQAALDATEGSLNNVAKNYLALVASKLRSHKTYKRVLECELLPALGERQVAELRRSDINAVLDRIERESGPSAADIALAVTRAMLNWHEKRSDTFRSPIARAVSRVNAKERIRKRNLDDSEIERFWKAAGDERLGMYGCVLRTLLLTGARRSEVAGMRRSEIATELDIDVWKLPASRSKNKQPITRPLSRAALDIINSMPVIGDSDYVFTLNGRTPIAMNFPDKKELLDEIANVRGWIVHDLRRTFRALLSRCRVAYEVKELLLGHAQSQIVRTYDDVLEHLPAMQEAVEKVAAEIARIVEGERGAKVVRGRFPQR
jgi:integrase